MTIGATPKFILSTIICMRGSAAMAKGVNRTTMKVQKADSLSVMATKLFSVCRMTFSLMKMNLTMVRFISIAFQYAYA